MYCVSWFLPPGAAAVLCVLSGISILLWLNCWGRGLCKGVGRIIELSLIIVVAILYNLMKLSFCLWFLRSFFGTILISSGGEIFSWSVLSFSTF